MPRVLVFRRRDGVGLASLSQSRQTWLCPRAAFCLPVADGSQGGRVFRKLGLAHSLPRSVRSRLRQACTRERSTTFPRPCGRQHRRRPGAQHGARSLRAGWWRLTWRWWSSVTSGSASRRRAPPVSPARARRRCRVLRVLCSPVCFSMACVLRDGLSV